MKFGRLTVLVVIGFLAGAPLLHAQNKVVVIPLGGDDVVKQPSFRIVPLELTNEAPTKGRLEYTADENPSPASNWGTVCDDCFDTTQCPVPTTTIDAAAFAVCKDLGFKAGIEETVLSPSSGSLPFILDDIVCPATASGFDDCASAPVGTHNCGASEQVGVECFTEAPKIVVPGVLLDCALPDLQNPGANDFVAVEDSSPGNPVFTEAGTDTLLLRWSKSPTGAPGIPATVSMRVVPLANNVEGWRFSLDCDDGFLQDFKNNQPFIIPGENGHRWEVATDVTFPAAGQMQIADVTISLVP